MTTRRSSPRSRNRFWPLSAVTIVMLFVLFSTAADAATRNGTGRADTILGTTSADRIDGKGGNDRINSGRGQDVVFGGTGNDAIRSEKNNDVVHGNAGNDFIDGGKDDDRLFGGAGNDSIQGGSGDDRIEGGPGNDRLQGQANTDIYTFRGKFGSDLVIDSSGNKDILVFPEVNFAQARIIRKGLNNVVIITPNGRVEIADQAEKNCKETKNGEPNIEGVRFRDADARISAGRTKARLIKVRSIAKTNCGRTSPVDCFGIGVCDDFSGNER